MIEPVLALLAAQGYKVFMRPFELNIIGIRSANGTPNAFDDSIYAIYRNDKRQWVVHSYQATTDPGLYWLNHPLNPNGTAILKCGQYRNSHMIGLHRNKYTALVQCGPVTVIRDADRNGSLDMAGKEDTGLFGINIHRALEEGETQHIDKFSAGCQVFANATDFDAFMKMCQTHRQLYGNGFSYTLVNQSPVFTIQSDN